MTITADTLIVRYPTLFDGEDFDIIDLLIVEAYAELPEEVWNDESTRDRGASLLCAHKWRLERGDLIRQGTAIKTMDENVNLHWHLQEDSLDWYRQTIYGREFLKLKRRVTGGSLFVV